MNSVSDPTERRLVGVVLQPSASGITYYCRFDTWREGTRLNTSRANMTWFYERMPDEAALKQRFAEFPPHAVAAVRIRRATHDESFVPRSGKCWRLLSIERAEDAQLAALQAKALARLSTKIDRPETVVIAGVGKLSSKNDTYGKSSKLPDGKRYDLRVRVPNGEPTESIAKVTNVIAAFVAALPAIRLVALNYGGALWNDWREDGPPEGASEIERERTRLDRALKLKSLSWETDMGVGNFDVSFTVGHFFGGHWLRVAVRDGVVGEAGLM